MPTTIRDDRLDDCEGPPAQRRSPKKGAQATQAIGRSRGGLSTKIHATAEAHGRPTGIHLTPGQAHDIEGAEALLPRNGGSTVIADRSYDAFARVIAPLEAAGKRVVIPSNPTRKHPREHDRRLYRLRHRIENVFARLKQWRSIATRYDKTARNFLGAIYFACAVLWLNSITDTP